MQLRKDLGGVQYCPSILAVFFDDGGKIQRAKYEGEMEIRTAFNGGNLKSVIGELMSRRVKLKMAETLAEHVAQQMSERERKIRE